MQHAYILRINMNGNWTEELTYSTKDAAIAVGSWLVDTGKADEFDVVEVEMDLGN